MALIGEMQYLTIGGNTYSLPSGGGGSVTSVAVSNATNGGLSVSGSPISSSGTITIGHSNVLSSAQTTQAVYPIKIDKNGHISAYGTAVTIPTKTSDLTNDSNFISDSAYMHTDNNYTTIEKNKLNGIAEGAEVNVNANWNENNSTSASYIQNRPFYLEENAEVVIFEEDIDFSNNYNGVLWNNFSYTFTDAIAVGTSVSLTVDDITLDAAVETEGTNLFIGIRDPSDSTRAATNHIGLGLGGSSDYAYQTTYVLALASMFSTGTHHVKLTTTADVYHKIDNNFIDLDIENGSGLKSVQQKQANASGDYSSAFGGGTAIGGYAHAEGNGTSASGSCAHAEGAFTKTSAQTAHAEGADTTASGESAHAEGAHTTASGQSAHAEGGFTTASGIRSHAEGTSTTASGWYSHAEGSNTIANHNAQHVFGEYNIADDSAATTSNRGNYVEIVGNGSKSTRSNARTLDWSGNEVLAGKLTIGAVGTDSMDVATIGQLPTVPANIVNTITTTAGTHTAISSKTGAVSFNVPTKTSHLTNDSGFITNAGVTGVKGNSESSYRTGQVNLTAANIGAIPSNSNGNTQNLLRPLQLNGLADNTLDAKINTLRANRLAFLPADQIIIEKTTDGGSTWTDAGVSDATKVGLFSETRAGVSIPLLNGVKNINCGLRITITGMKYNVPSGTAETSKYNYWNSNYIASTERYNQLKEMYFWVSANSDTISVKVERATGAASTTWNTIFDNSSYGMTGWSGNDYICFAQGVFGGGTNQTSNYWNYRLTFFTRGPGGSTTLSGTNTTSAQSIQEIRGYGDTWWTAGNEYAANDKIYTHDYLKNVTFPAKVTASGGFSGNVTGAASKLLYGTCSTAAGTAAKTVTVDSSFKLETGATVAVKFSNANTAASPTLNVNSTGAKGLMRYGNTYAGTAVATAWNAGSVLSLLYDGSYWQIMDWQNDSNVTQNHSTSTAVYNMALANYSSSSGGTSTLNHSNKIQANPSTGDTLQSGRATTADLSSSDITTFVNSLNYSQINAVDYVVEQGVSGNWSWRKWNSGIGECWLQYNPGSYTCGTTRGSLYSGGNLTLTYPITFTSYPAVTGSVSLGTDAYVVWLQFNGLGTNTATCRIVSSGSVAANSSYLISVYVTGRWK